MVQHLGASWSFEKVQNVKNALYKNQVVMAVLGAQIPVFCFAGPACNSVLLLPLKLSV